MKRYLLTACAIAIGSLGLIAPRASAAGGDKTYQVPFTGLAASFCLLDLGVVLPGTLQISADGASLQTLTPGSVAYTCNSPTRIESGMPVQDVSALGAGAETIDGTLTSQIEGVTTAGVNLNITKGVSVEIGAGVNLVTVSMQATDDDGSIAAGLYDFDVPLTVTCL